MNEPRKDTQTVSRWQAVAAYHLKHDRRLLWSILTILLVSVAVTILPARADDPGQQDIMLTLPLAMPPATAQPASETPPVAAQWTVVTVEPGQTLSAIFSDLDLGYAALDKVMSGTKHAEALKTLHPGDEIAFQTAADGSLKALRFNTEPATRVVITLGNDDSLHETVVQRPLERHTHVAEASIESSLFAAAADAGMSSAMVIKLADVFKYDIDFIKDLRKGDHFSVVYDDVWSDGERLYPGRIIAAEFVNRGHRYTAYRFEKPDGSVAYFDEDGRPLQKALMRTPVKFSRISSRFSRHRKHPVLGYTRAHEGVDYAAPTGTPIHAAGDGVIAVRGRVRGYGRFIRIKHNKKYSTAYGHMSRFAPGLHVGSHVRQGQVIGYVGMSGLATGPHLHYEVRVHGKPVNPLTITMPKPKPLPKALLADFKLAIAPMAERLDTMEDNRKILLASLADGRSDGIGTN